MEAPKRCGARTHLLTAPPMGADTLLMVRACRGWRGHDSPDGAVPADHSPVTSLPRLPVIKPEQHSLLSGLLLWVLALMP